MNTPQFYKSARGKETVLKTYETVLQRWPVPYKTLEIPTRAGKTFVLSCGPQGAPALILLHGSSSNLTMWVGEVAEYSGITGCMPSTSPVSPG